MAAIPSLDVVGSVISLASYFGDSIPSVPIKSLRSESTKYLKDIAQSASKYVTSVETKQKSTDGYFPFDELKWYCDVYEEIDINKKLKRKFKQKPKTKEALDKLFDVLTFDYVGFVELNMGKLKEYGILAELSEIDIKIGKFLAYTYFVPQTRAVKSFLSGQSVKIREIISSHEYTKM